MPSAFDSLVRITLVSVFLTEMAAPGITAPVASLTCPLTEALPVWAASGAASSAHTRSVSAQNRVIKIRTS
jgi:hypothetical protein